MALAGFLITASLLERLATYRKREGTRYQPKVFLVRTLLLAIIYGFWFGLTDRPIAALVLALATAGVFVASSRAKEHLLGEPLVFLDLQFIGQILRHPRLYYAQLLLAPQNAIIGLAILLVMVGLLFALATMEKPLEVRMPLLWKLFLLSGPILLWALPRQKNIARCIQSFLPEPATELRPQVATARWGIFVPMLAHYSRWIVDEQMPAAVRPLRRPRADRKLLPHVIAVQCESFIDPARIFRNPPDMPFFREAKSRATMHGPLEVPCGGAYTMRTEFSFLTGIPPEKLGCDRFNPYARAERREYPALAKTLKEAGYETDFVHPHDLQFFRRDTVMPSLGFDQLHGAEEFRASPRCGPHVSDTALAGYIARLFDKSAEPRFVFAVTMENHGPWFSGRLPDCSSGRDAYLRHLTNSDRMLGMLTGLASALDRPLVLCWYGDHSPILDYDIAHDTPPHSDYLITTTELSRSSAPEPAVLYPHDLASVLLALIDRCTKATPHHAV
jgi:hypothetical protein